MSKICEKCGSVIENGETECKVCSEKERTEASGEKIKVKTLSRFKRDGIINTYLAAAVSHVLIGVFWFVDAFIVGVSGYIERDPIGLLVSDYQWTLLNYLLLAVDAAAVFVYMKAVLTGTTNKRRKLFIPMLSPVLHTIVGMIFSFHHIAELGDIVVFKITFGGWVLFISTAAAFLLSLIISSAIGEKAQ